MYCDEILVGTNDTVINNYLDEIHSDLELIFGSEGVFIMDKSKILEFVPYSNILNVVNLSNNEYICLYVTYNDY